MSHPNGATTSLKGHPTFLFQSTIRICFHERRLQYTEREQMLAWQRARPGERLLEVDVPLSYGMVDVCQPSPSNNSVEFMWDPTKEVGVYIKVQERDLQIKKEDRPQLQLIIYSPLFQNVALSIKWWPFCGSSNFCASLRVLSTEKKTFNVLRKWKILVYINVQFSKIFV